MTGRKKLSWLVGILGLGLVLGAAVCAWIGISTSLDAETTLQSYVVVLNSVTKYVENRPGQWPPSWEELLLVVPTDEERWPGIDEIKKRVTIDFSATPEAIVAMDPNHFNAIEQRSPNYGPRPWNVQVLQAAMKKGLGN